MKSRIFIEGIDGLRAIAALLVLLFHYYSFSSSTQFTGSFIVRAGWIGVDIFFVISGFVLSLPFLNAFSNNEKYSISLFYKRRMLRIIPAYYFSLLVITTFLHADILFNPDTFRHLVGHLTFSEGFLYPWKKLNINGVYWSLWIEMQFYIIVPLLVVLFKENRWWISFVSILVIVTVYKYAGIVLTEGLSDTHTLKQFYINKQLLGVLQEFVMGIGAAKIYLLLKDSSVWINHRLRFSSLVIIGFIVIISCMYFITSYGNTKYWFGSGALGYIPLITLNTILSLGSSLVILGIASQAKWINYLFGNRVMIFLGTISYGIYIWHYPVGKYMSEKMNMESSNRFMLLCFFGIAVTILWAYISYRFIEKPFLKKHS